MFKEDVTDTNVSKLVTFIRNFEYNSTLPLEPVMYNNFWAVIKEDENLERAVYSFIENRKKVYKWLNEIVNELRVSNEIQPDYTEINRISSEIYSQKKEITDYFLNIWKLNPLIYTPQGFSFYGYTFMETSRENLMFDSNKNIVYDTWVRINPKTPINTAETYESSKITAEPVAETVSETTPLINNKKSNSVLPFVFVGVIIALMNN